MKKSNPLALIPIGVFVAFYLSLGIVFEYVMKIPMGFYSVPVVVAFLIALFVAVLQTKGVKLDKKFEIMGEGVGDKNIITMLLIFMLAGIFVGVVGRSSAESVAYFMLSVTPARFAVVVLFVVSCFVSTAMGTSVGTITLITPIAVAIAEGSGFPLALCVGTVVGGAMFGDNLSFISDTTIAACNGQGCQMKDKFKTNFAVVVPAAIVTLGLIIALSLKADVAESVSKEYDMIQVIPYVLVLISGIIGVNVFLTLMIGIVSGSIIMLVTGSATFTSLLAGMKTGAEGMFETSMVAILVAALCALIRFNGGFEALLSGVSDDTAEDAPADTQLPEATLLKQELSQKLAEAIDSLTEKERLVISLHYYEHLKLCEIAKVLKVSEARVCQTRSKAILKMQKYMKDYMKG